MNIWVTSDHHFWHKNIIGYCGRPFRTVEGMNFALMQRWNATVHPDDLVIHLGDVCLCSFEEAMKIVPLLNGHKVLVLGNHDRFSKGGWRTLGFRQVCKQLRIGKLLMTHEAVPISEPDITANIHGHCHDHKPHKYSNRFYRNHFNVSVEVTAYRPVNLRDLVEDLCNEVDTYYKEKLQCDRY
jgi:calcineurin-like phosphoesterase family protein